MIIQTTYDASSAVPMCADYRIEIVRSVADAEPYIEAWEALAKAAAEPNVFYSPWALLPALEHLAGDKRFVLLFMLRATEETTQTGLVVDGFFPLLERAPVPSGPCRWPECSATVIASRWRPWCAVVTRAG